MSPPVPPLAQSESKAKFLQRLGLDEQTERNVLLYSLMKDEILQGWERLLSSGDALAENLRNNASVEPPYRNAQIHEPAIRRELYRVYHTARNETRAIYNLGVDRVQPDAPNWVMRWLLWHVIRYRDPRNKPKNTTLASPPRQPPPSSTQVGTSKTPTATRAVPRPAPGQCANHANLQGRNTFWKTVSD